MKIIVNSILYLFGFGENPLPKPKAFTSQSDIDAISSDWRNVGMDIRNSMNQYETQQAARG